MHKYPKGMFPCWIHTDLMQNDVNPLNQFVGQLWEDKSLALDLLYNWPPNSGLLLNKSLLDLIYFLNIFILARKVIE